MCASIHKKCVQICMQICVHRANIFANLCAYGHPNLPKAAPKLTPSRFKVAPEVAPSQLKLSPKLAPSRFKLAPKLAPSQLKLAPKLGPKSVQSCPKVGPQVGLIGLGWIGCWMGQNSIKCNACKQICKCVCILACQVTTM